MKNLLFTFFASLLLITSSYAQTTWVVDSLNDSGLGSLRAAADSCVAGDTIRFNASLIASGSDSIVLTTGEIAFDSVGVVIKGLYTTTDTLHISGNNNSRIFSFDGAGRVVLDSLVLKNGNTSSDGGAIYRVNCTDTLIVANSTISGNTATLNGGGIASNDSSSVCVINSTISGNTTSHSGGGINAYNVSVTNSTISGNSCPAVNFAYGGGINSSYITISYSTISGNTAGYGGGVSLNNYHSSTSISVTNSTISGNTALAGNGGGIYSYSYDGDGSSSSGPFSNFSTVTITNSTILGNTAYYAGGGGYSHSYYITTYNSNLSTSSVTVTNSTLTGNTAIYGGGVYSKAYSAAASSYTSSSNSIVTVTNSTLTGNTASDGGGGTLGLILILPQAQTQTLLVTLLSS